MSESLRIAVADDEGDMRDYFQRVLGRLGHKVVGVAKSGEELIQLCRNTHPDVIITDIKMNDTDGIDAADIIIDERPVPVIVVSAYFDPTLVSRARPDRFQGYLVKPIKQSDLGPALQLALARFRQNRESA